MLVMLAGTVCTVVWLNCGLSGAASRSLRWIGRACWVILIACHVLWAYLALVFGILLAYFSNYVVGLAGVGAAEWRWKFGDR